MTFSSVSGKNWIYKKFDTSDVTEFAEKYSLTEIVAKLLSIRKKNIDDIDLFLNPKIKNLLPNPMQLKDMKNAIDRTYDQNAKVVMQSEERRIYVATWIKTFKVSVYVTFYCLVLGFPVAHLLANLPLRYSNLLMIFVLLPFWTSLLVRTTAWIVMLQQNGVINGVLVWLGILSDEGRIQMVYNMTGTIIAMTQILLPFMILPLYSVMKVIPKSHMRAAQNLGAKPAKAFMRVYLPQTIPGMSAGGLLVFVLAIGYFITPELVGGKDGQLIGHWIAYHLKTTINWGLCSALGAILLGIMLILYWLYNKIVGIDNIKLG